MKIGQCNRQRWSLQDTKGGREHFWLRGWRELREGGGPRLERGPERALQRCRRQREGSGIGKVRLVKGRAGVCLEWVWNKDWESGRKVELRPSCQGAWLRASGALEPRWGSVGLLATASAGGRSQVGRLSQWPRGQATGQNGRPCGCRMPGIDQTFHRPYNSNPDPLPSFLERFLLLALSTEGQGKLWRMTYSST